ncbi:ATP-dependent helicase [bacterium]|nr:ATP-dependent helicase [bacterium]
MEQNLMEKLNKEQLDAVTHKDGPVMIVAGAGTGKTTVITQRIAYLIEQGKAAADEILALTFTEKAAGEMEERVDRLLPMGYVDLWISTFHGFGERILKDYGHEIGLPGGAKLLNEFEQYALIKNNFEKFDLDYYRPLGNPTKFIHALIKHFSRLKDEDISPAQYLEYTGELKENLDSMLGGVKGKIKKSTVITSKQNKRSNPDDGKTNTGLPRRSAPPSNSAGRRNDNFQTDDKEIAEQEVSRINEAANAYHVYGQLLLDNGAFDFGDLINYTLRFFRERPRFLKKFSQQFKFILVDEFQDTNWAQYELIKLLAAPKNNLFVVGDDDQSIYKFRGASVANILQFRQDYPKAKEIILTKNYRNRQNILDLAYNFIQFNNPNRLECQLNTRKKDTLTLNKKLIAEEKGKGIIEVIKGADVHEEIRLIVERIAELKIKDKEASWNDFGILVRANESAKEISIMLEQAGFPYLFLASRGLYAKPIILNIIAYFKLLDSYHESTAMYRILNFPIFNFTYSELVNFNYIANKKSWSLYTALKNANGKLGNGVQKKIDQVLNIIDKHTALARSKNTLEVFLAFLNDSGYLKYIAGLDELASQEQIGYLNQIKKRIEQFQASSDDQSIKAFLEEFNMELEAGEQGSLAPDWQSGPETIKLMTIHAAKGLEFKYVFAANMVDKRFPTIMRRDQIEIPDALVKEIVPEGDMHLEEERRLFYVALTRAKYGLFLTWAPDYGGLRKKKPSRFLVESNLVSDSKDKAEKQDKKKAIADLRKKPLVVAGSQTAYRPPVYFSYTQLAAFSNCPYQYRFAHIFRIPRHGKPQFSFGKTMHSTMQKISELVKEKSGLGQSDLFSPAKTMKATGEVDIKLDEMYSLYEDSWIDEWYRSQSDKEAHKKRGKEIIKGFHAKYNKNWPQTLFLEKGFNLKINVNSIFYTVRGMMDRIDEVKGKVKIVDYKTGKPKEKLNFKDKEQLFIYQLAMRDLFKREVKSLAFYYLENNSEVEFLGDDSDLEKVNDSITETITDINKGEFPARPGPLCKYCDFFDICEFRKS